MSRVWPPQHVQSRYTIRRRPKRHNNPSTGSAQLPESHRATGIRSTAAARWLMLASAIVEASGRQVWCLRSHAAGVIEPFGLALARAPVLLDALVIRLLLLPAVLHLLGPRTWYIPSWLDRYFPRLAIEPPRSADGPRPDSCDASEPAGCARHAT